jgi:transposase
MEACGTAHPWGREARVHGQSVRLLPPHAVRRDVLRNKTDRADAKGILEAHRNEDIRSVPVKTVEQHVLASLHRLRSGTMATRTARPNTVRGLLRELGIPIPLGARRVVPEVWALISDGDTPVPDSLRPAWSEAAREVSELEIRTRSVEEQLEALSRQSPLITQLRTIPGIGLLTATALVAGIGDVHRFPSGRHLASFLGLTPRESSSGNTRRLRRISKKGDPYLRRLLLHGPQELGH